MSKWLFNNLIRRLERAVDFKDKAEMADAILRFKMSGITISECDKKGATKWLSLIERAEKIRAEDPDWWLSASGYSKNEFPPHEPLLPVQSQRGKHAKRKIGDKGPAIRCNASIYAVEKADLIKWHGGLSKALKYLHTQGPPSNPIPSPEKTK